MTIKDILLSTKPRDNSPPGSIFEVKTSDGSKRLMCWASFLWPIELAEMVSKNPDLLTWDITKENFTQSELDNWKEA